MFKKFRKCRNLWLILLNICVAAMAFTSLRFYFLDSEFWSMTVAKELFNFDTDQIGIYYKIPFYLLLNLPHLLASDNVSLVLIARSLFVVVSIGVLYLSYQIAKDLLKSRSFALLHLFLLLNTTFYYVHSTQVRSDIFSCLFFTLNWFTLLKIKKNGWQPTLQQKLILFFATLAMLATTPKSVFLLIILVAIFVVEFKFAPPTAKDTVKKLLIMISAPFAVLATSYVVSHSSHYKLLEKSYNAAFELFKNNITEGFTDTYTLLTFARDNSLFLAAALMATAWGLRTIWHPFKSARDSNIRMLAICCAIATLIIGLHSQRMQFFIAIYLPFYSLLITALLQKHIKKFKYRDHIFATLILLSVFKMAFITDYALRAFTNETQLQFINDLEDYTAKFKTAKYYDSIGVLPKLKQDYAYISPYDGTYDLHTKKIIQSSPDIILYTTRVYLIREKIDKFLDKNYLQVAPDFWVKQFLPQKTEIRIVNGRSYEALNLFILLQDFLDRNDPSYTLHIYDLAEFKPSTPAKFLVYDKKNNSIHEFYKSIDIINFIAFNNAAQDASAVNNIWLLNDYELLLEPQKQGLSLYPPFETIESEQSPQYLFAYKSYF